MQALEQIAQQMVAAGKGILAADESNGTIAKRFDSIGVESTENNRRDWRALLFSSDQAMREFISGVILFDETIRQKTADGTPLTQLITQAGALPGIKVDRGAMPLAGCAGETITEGLDGLRERLNEYFQLGAKFAKWRAVLKVGASRVAMDANASALARYAALCQEANIVPIVEPEVLMDGSHTIDDCFKTTQATLNMVFRQLKMQRVHLEGIILKPNMVVSGTDCPQQASPDEVAEKTLRLLKRCVPAAVPGIAFLSGGQSDKDATAHLNQMNQLGQSDSLPWALTFSYGRALQAAPLKAWTGAKDNIPAAQQNFSHRAQMNGLASLGQWKAELEKTA
jgi:fructose-bisphosphate aldolase class I